MAAMAAKQLDEQLKATSELSDPKAQADAMKDIILGNHPNDADSVKVKEAAVGKLADLYAKHQDASALRGLLTELRPLFAAIPKAKTAKLVRTIIDTIAKVPNSTAIQVRMLVWLS